MAELYFEYSHMDFCERVGLHHPLLHDHIKCIGCQHTLSHTLSTLVVYDKT